LTTQRKLTIAIWAAIAALTWLIGGVVADEAVLRAKLKRLAAG